MFIIIGGDGREYGPATAEQVRAWIAAGRADLDTKAKALGSIEWKSLREFPEFGGEGSTPESAPPPPPLGDDLAPRSSRLAAYLVDRAILLVCILPGSLLIGPDMLKRMAQGEMPEGVEMAKTAEGALIFLFGAFIYLVVQSWLLSARGQSLGKMALRIRIVRYTDGGPSGFVHAVLLRSWLVSIATMIPFLGYAIAIVDPSFIFSPDRRCLHDRLADTKVIRV